ncbi:MAG: hypothetical protein AAF639_32450 [Chloroflexota bacterium]
MTRSRSVGLLFMFSSTVLLISFLSWLFTAFSNSTITSSSLGIGVALVFLILSPIFGIGAYVYRQSRAEQKELDYIQQQNKLLNILLAQDSEQGCVRMSDLIVTLHQPRTEIEEMIHDLIQKQLFSGAANWQEGVFYTVGSDVLVTHRACPHCEATIRFGGNQQTTCDTCGSVIFLTKRGASTLSVERIV